MIFIVPAEREKQMSLESSLHASLWIRKRNRRSVCNWIVAAMIVPLLVVPLAVWAKASNTLESISSPASGNAAAEHSARVTTNYIDAKISLDYPGFEGLSLDSLGKAHFPLVVLKPPTQPWRPTEAKRRGSRSACR